MLAQGSYSSPSLNNPLPTDGSRLVHLAAALDTINEGAVLINTEGQLIWHNKAFDKLLVENGEGHVLVAAVIEFGEDFLTNLPRTRSQLEAVSVSNEATVGHIEHEFRCTLMPRGMLGNEEYVLCLIRRSASRWSSYEQHLRHTCGLTQREAQVAVECLRGKKNLEIAEDLKISVETVNKHLDKVYQKSGVRGRAELASRLLDSGLS